MRRMIVLVTVGLFAALAGAPALADNTGCNKGENAMSKKLIILLARKPGTTVEQFKTYYETVHAPGARERMPALARAEYRRNFIPEQGRPGAPIDFDVVTEMIFASEAEYAQMQKERETAAQWIADDIPKFADPANIRSYVADVCVSG
ncbi:EthD domain-containing protein [Emcibacter sp. SYSU 3D8]|uniref:EthD domain-containing protein n=1 Tax=Emcibacter sp. SYSU 3D8 TaxID=3133969 RepID=UPI0031FE8B1B